MVLILHFLCLPRLRRPCTSASRMRLTQWSPSRHQTCPYHLSIASHIFFSTACNSNCMGNVSIPFLVLQCDTQEPTEHSYFRFFSRSPSSLESTLLPYHSFIDRPFNCNRYPSVAIYDPLSIYYINLEIRTPRRTTITQAVTIEVLQCHIFIDQQQVKT